MDQIRTLSDWITEELTSEEDYHSVEQGDESYQGKSHIEPIFSAFVCPLTKEVMRDPVTIENGHTFEREAIEKWFQECRDVGKMPICPLTLKELSSTELNPSIALRNTIEEWIQRNEAAQLDMACRSICSESSERDVLQALKYIVHICKKYRSSKHVVHNVDLITMITNMLRSSSRRVRCKALEALRMVAEDNDENKEVVAAGDNIRTVIKFLSHEYPLERELSVSLLYELSKSELLCERIGGVYGAILLLDGMASSTSENISIVEKAEKTLVNLEKCDENVRQMAENGRLQPLLNLLLEGPPEMQMSMAAYLGELVLANDVKFLVAQTVGSSLVNVMKTGGIEAREAALKALNQISSYEASAKILIQEGILPPLIKDLFAVGVNQLPMRLKEVSATILANIVASSADFEAIPLNDDNQNLVSEDIVHNLLHLISNTGPAIECKLLQVLVGLTSSSTTALKIVSAIKSSGAAISLVQFIEAPQRDIQVASLKLLQNISPFMGQELADVLRGAAGQLAGLITLVSESNGILEEQAAAISLLANLPERDLGFTGQLWEEGAFNIIISRVVRIRQGETRGNRYVTPFLEGLVRVLSRLTYFLHDEPQFVAFARDHNLASLFTDLLQMNGLDKVQMVSAMALEKLAKESRHLTRFPETPEPGWCSSIFPCFSKPPVVTGLCHIHHGICSMKENFCLLEGKAVEKLIACLDHANEKVVEAALAALCTLLDDGVDIEQGVMVLCEADGIRPILDVLLESRTEMLRHRAVWAVERILRTEDISNEISGDQSVGSALIEAFRHGDYVTKQIAERALKHVDRLPNFSDVFLKRS
ncbi:U-box domain-containing protein 44-like [Elaeis guineensis]|uniref:RING-type E3 ubiquitin transferase n=1 Tax=Elaeis guineensis var. tenera TaxID=51953 RepID=A0A6I9SA57_ELAGV|nr:U-box domain-containing protein 44-like [Elaeis guineensis]